MKFFIHTLIIWTIFVSHYAFAQSGGYMKSAHTHLEKSISILAGSDLGCKTEEDCEALPVGLRSCGGPEKYVVISTENASYDVLIDLGAVSESLGQVNLRKNTSFSICTIVLPPQLTCRKNKCVVK